MELKHVSEDHAAWYMESLERPDLFWGELARARLSPVPRPTSLHFYILLPTNDVVYKNGGEVGLGTRLRSTEVVEGV